MQTKSHQLIIFIGGFFLFLIDRFIKFLSTQIFTEKYTLKNFFGWNPFRNTGIAFSLPVQSSVAIALSIPILILIIFFIITYYKKENNNIYIGLIFLFFGALSNLFDRIVYNATIDYWLLGTGIINLADLMIIFGIYLIFKNRHSLNK